MKFKNLTFVKKYFERGNVCVCGERGRGKDMLMSNIICRRKLDYISNTPYPRKKGLPIKHYPLDFKKINLGGNTYRNFVDGNVLPYTYPYPLGVDVYISDVGVYFPSQFCNELNKEYKEVPNFMSLSRHVAEANVHINLQTLNRAWDKLREQSRTYITAQWCKVLKMGKKRQLVIQKIRVHEKYQSCLDNVPPLKLPLWAYLGKDKMMAQLYKLNYRIQHGKIDEFLLIYWNESDYDTHVFRTMMGGDKIEK